MKLRAVKECPNQLPGSIFEVPDVLGDLFVSLKIAEPYTESSDDTPPKRRYRRRDLEAQDD